MKISGKLTTTVVLTAIAAIVVFTVNTAEPIQNEKFFDFPLEFGEWKGNDVFMEEYVYQLLDTKYFFLRNYYSPRHDFPINLSIVWFDDKNISFHAPEACLGGVGHKVREKGTINANILGNDLEIGKLIVSQGREPRQVVLYYFDVDGYLTTSQIDVRFHVLKKRLFFRRTSASFVRIMAPVLIDEKTTISSMLAFMQEISALLPNHLYTEQIRSIPHA